MNLNSNQKAALEKLEHGNILWGGVGSGKSRVALAWYVSNENGEDLVVITTAKKRDSLDWEKEAAPLGLGKEKDATKYGTLTVDSWNNLDKYADRKNTFFIFDEQRLVGSGAWVKAFYKIVKNGNPWIMLSATPGDTWLDYIPVFVANGFFKNRTEFKREHVVYNTFTKFPKVDRYVGVGKLVRLRNQILVKLKYDKETTRHSEVITVEYDQEMMDRVLLERWNDLENRPIRDIAEMFHCARRIANSDPSRIAAVRSLLKKHDRLIVFYSFNYELDLLRELADGEHVLAEWNGHKHEEIPKDDKWIYIVHYIAGAEGWNCTSTDAMCFYSLTYSYKLWEQAHGRIDRLNTKFSDLYYYTLKSKAKIDVAIWKALKSKKSFQQGNSWQI